MNINATIFKQRLGQYMDIAETTPVIVQKSGRPKSVLISHALYQYFLKFQEEMEDLYWLQRAKKNEAEGFMGVEETDKFLKNLLNEKETQSQQDG